MRLARTPTDRRAAAATVELAVVLLPLMMLILGMIELSRALMVQHILNNAARAGARVGTFVTGDPTLVGYQPSGTPYGASLPAGGIFPALNGQIDPTKLTVYLNVGSPGSSPGSGPNNYQLDIARGGTTTLDASSPSWPYTSSSPPATGSVIQVTIYVNYSDISWLQTLWPDAVNARMSSTLAMNHE